MPLIDQNFKNVINEHDQKDAISSGVRSFSKNLISATEIATVTAKTPKGETDKVSLEKLL